MSYLYITESGSTFSIDGGYFVVKEKNDLIRKIPKETLESVSLFGNISVTTPCVRELLKKGISVSYFSEAGAYFGKLCSTSHTNIKRMKQQLRLSEDDDFSLNFAKQLIKAKINNQSVVLRRYAKDSDVSVAEQYEDMKYSLSRIENVNTYNELIGYEGRAAKSYFSALSRIINKDFAFKGRNRMPPKDPFNSMLSLGYTLLMYEIYGEIENKGITPYAGFLHKDHERHPTLASDLMEEWRAVIVDSVVLSLIQGNEIHIDDFVSDDETNGVYITKKGMSIFIKKYEAKLRSTNKYLAGINMSYRRCINYQVNALVNALESEDATVYQPVFIR